jgi:hypothetical protein
LSVYFFPTGIVGKLRTLWQDRKSKATQKRDGGTTGEAM